MKHLFNFIALLAIIISSNIAYSQSYFTNGNARAIGGSCYQLTGASNWQLGSVWYADKLDLSEDFDLEFELNFGNNDGGADGIVFVLQTVGNRAIGLQGGGIGFEGFSPSLGIEFDSWNNTSLGDLSSDHIAVFKNGSVDHTSSNAITSPVSALTTSGNIEDGQNHLVRITWDASTQQLEVWFDCYKRQSTYIDIVNTIFNGEKQVFWGFTSATGGANNTHIACLRDDILLQDTFAICKGDKTLLNAKESFDNSYSWTPTNFLDNPTIRTPECSSEIPYTYYVEYKDRCNNTVKDTVHIDIDQPFTIDEGRDTLLCDGRAYAFDLRGSYDSILWNNGLNVERISWFTEGFYKLRVWRGVCFDDDSFNILTDVSPAISISGDSIFCEDGSTEITTLVTPTSASFIWQDGSTSDMRTFDETTPLSVEATNACGTADEKYYVREIILPALDLGIDSTLCEGDTIWLEGPIQPNLQYAWSLGETQQTIAVTEPGEYSLIISEADLCFDYDSVSFDGVSFPVIGLLSDVLLCKNEEITLTVDAQYGEVIWDNSLRGEQYVLKNREGTLKVKAVNQCGADSTELNVSLIDCYCRVWLPNAITVNRDGLNEALRPTLDCPKLRTYSLEVYNRWGERLWQSRDSDAQWDATYKGRDVQQGVYFWIARWSGVQNGIVERFTDRGVLHVIR